MEFYTIRHAETTYNAQHIFTGGGSDPSLTVDGIKQAKTVGLQIKGIIPALIPYTSNHIRCIQTMRHLGFKNIPLAQIDSRLKEVDLGIFEGTPYKNIEGYTKDYLNYKPEGGESYREAIARVVSFLSEMINMPSDPFLLDTPFICTSSGIIRILKGLENKIPISDLFLVTTTNCEINKHNLNLEDLDFYGKHS